MNQLDKVKAKVYISILEELPLTVEVGVFEISLPVALHSPNLPT